MKRSSASSPICRLPSRRPVSIPLLCATLAASLLSLMASAAPAALAVPLAAAAVLYTGLCMRSMLRAEAFVLALAADGRFGRELAGGFEPLDAVRWQDFGYLAVLRCRHEGQPAVHFWWRRLLPEGQRRALWRMMNASATGKLENPPSLIVNPLL